MNKNDIFRDIVKKGIQKASKDSVVYLNNSFMFIPTYTEQVPNITSLYFEYESGGIFFKDSLKVKIRLKVDNLEFTEVEPKEEDYTDKPSVTLAEPYYAVTKVISAYQAAMNDYNTRKSNYLQSNYKQIDLKYTDKEIINLTKSCMKNRELSYKTYLDSKRNEELNLYKKAVSNTEF